MNSSPHSLGIVNGIPNSTITSEYIINWNKLKSRRFDCVLNLNLNTTSLVSIATITINYLFLVWWLISFNGANIIYIAITLVLVLISEAVIDNFKGLPLSMLLTLFNCAGIHIVSLIYDYVTNEAFSYILTIVLALVVIFIFLYFTYNLFRQINNIVIKHKYLKNKKYTV